VEPHEQHPPTDSPAPAPEAQTPPHQPPAASAAGPVAGPATDDEKNLATLAHGLGAAGYFLGIGSWVAPLIIWLLKKDQSPWVGENAKEALNFQITVSLALLIVSPTIACFGLGLLLAGPIWIAGVVLSIIGTIKASNGEAYRYPLTLRLIK
jgi:uncharacterized Tic20 family protein